MITCPDTVNGPIKDHLAGPDGQGWPVVVTAHEDVVDTPSRLEFPLATLGSRGQRVLGREGVSGFARVSRSPGVAVADTATVEGLCARPVADAGGVRVRIQVARHDDVCRLRRDVLFEIVGDDGSLALPIRLPCQLECRRVIDEQDGPNRLRYVELGHEARAQKSSCPITHWHLDLMISNDRPPAGDGIPLSIGQPDSVMKKVISLTENVGGLVVTGCFDHFLQRHEVRLQLGKPQPRHVSPGIPVGAHAEQVQRRNAYPSVDNAADIGHSLIVAFGRSARADESGARLAAILDTTSIEPAPLPHKLIFAIGGMLLLVDLGIDPTMVALGHPARRETPVPG